MSTDPELIKREVYTDNEASLKDLIYKFREWFQYFLSKWHLLLVAGLIGGLFGLAYSHSVKPIYTAELNFVLEDDQAGGGMGGALGLASQFGFDFGGGGGGAFSGDNLIELMKSRSMVEKSLLSSLIINGKQQTLAEYYMNFTGLGNETKKTAKLDNIKFFDGAMRSSFNRQQDSLLGKIYKKLIAENLSVFKRDKKLNIVSVNVKSIDELFSKYFTETLVQKVSEFYIQTKTKKATQNVAVLQHQTDSVRRQLNSAITGVASSVDVNPNPNLALQILRAPSQKRQIDVQANTTILSELVKNLELSKLVLRRETPLIQIIDKPILPLEKEGLSKLKGLLFGGCISGLLVIVYLIMKKLLDLL